MTRVYTTRRTKDDKWFVLDRDDWIPAEICACAAGRDAHLQNVPLPCAGCGKIRTARQLHQSDLPGHCDDCAAEFYCPHGTHPEDPCEECEANR